jgi:hypothetical protein
MNLKNIPKQNYQIVLSNICKKAFNDCTTGAHVEHKTTIHNNDTLSRDPTQDSYS